MNEQDKKTCGNCKYWSFRLGGLPTGKEWGNCLNMETHKSIRVSLLGFDGSDFTDTAEQQAMLRKEIYDTYYLQFDEDSFCCVNWERTT